MFATRGKAGIGVGGYLQLRGAAFPDVAVGRFGQKRCPKFGGTGGTAGADISGKICSRISKVGAGWQICDIS